MKLEISSFFGYMMSNVDAESCGGPRGKPEKEFG
jgi:hypothetical protein